MPNRRLISACLLVLAVLIWIPSTASASDLACEEATDEMLYRQQLYVGATVLYYGLFNEPFDHRDFPHDGINEQQVNWVLVETLRQLFVVATEDAVLACDPTAQP